MRNYTIYAAVWVLLFGCSHFSGNEQLLDRRIKPTLNSSEASRKEKSFTTAKSKTITVEPLSSSKAASSARQDVHVEDTAIPSSHTPIKVTPLTTFNNAPTASNNNFRNSYTRILITSELNGDSKGHKTGEDMLPYNTRFFLRRLFWGFKQDINLTAKIKIGDYESTSPLITLSQQSNREGEYWSRSVSHKLLDFPLFLVKEDGGASVPDIRISLAGSKNYESNMSGVALQVATTAVQQVNPSAKVLTKLTEQSTKDTARAIDGVIGKLFSNGIKEEHISDCDLRTWATNGGVLVELHIPVKDGGDWDSGLHTVGKWTISFDEPRPSIFSDRRICQEGNLCSATREEALSNVYREINPGQVLNYTLVKNGNGLGTIRAYILQQKWFVSSLTALRDSDAGATATEKAALRAANAKISETFCRNIYDEITGLGLNGDDANIVIWAILKGLPETTIIDMRAVGSATTCSTAMTTITPSEQASVVGVVAPEDTPPEDATIP